MFSVPYPHPHSYQYSPAMYQHGYYASPSYSAPVTTASHSGVALQPHASGWPGWQGSYHSSYSQSGLAGSSKNGEALTPTAWNHGKERATAYTSRPPRRSKNRARARFDCNYCGKFGHLERTCYSKFPHLRPVSDTCADQTIASSPDECLTSSTQLYPPQAQVSDWPDPCDNVSQGPRRPSSVAPYSPCVAPAKNSDPDTQLQDTTPLVQRHVVSSVPSLATNLTPHDQKFPDTGHCKDELDGMPQQAGPSERTQNAMSDAQDSSQSTSAASSIEAATVETVGGITVEEQNVTWVRITEEVISRLSTPGKQVGVQLDIAQSHTTPEEPFDKETEPPRDNTPAKSELTDQRADSSQEDKPTPAKKTVESTDGTPAGVKDEPAPTETTAFARSAPIADDVKPTPATPGMEPAESVSTPVNIALEHIEVVADDSQLAQTDNAVERLCEGLHITSTTTLPGTDDLADQTAELVPPAPSNQDQVPRVNAWDDVHYGAAQDVKSPMHPRERKRRDPRNKKVRTKRYVSLWFAPFSSLTVSRERTSDVSQHSRSTTHTAFPHPPTKRVKEEVASSPVPRAVPRLPAANGWGNFFAHIKQDDVVMTVKAKQDYERKGGDTFRPEMKETYKDQKGKKEIKVHTKVGGRVDANVEAAGVDTATVKKEESPEGGIRLERGVSSDVDVKTA